VHYSGKVNKVLLSQQATGNSGGKKQEIEGRGQGGLRVWFTLLTPPVFLLIIKIFKIN